MIRRLLEWLFQPDERLASLDPDLTLVDPATRAEIDDFDRLTGAPW